MIGAMPAGRSSSPWRSPKRPIRQSRPCGLRTKPSTKQNLYLVHRGEHVLDDIVGMFEADGDAYQAIANAKFGPLCWREPLVCGRCRVRDKTFGVAQIVADPHQLQGVLKTERGFLAALYLEGDEG